MLFSFVVFHSNHVKSIWLANNNPFQITDLLFFLVILVVVIFAYGVASKTLRYPNDTVEWTLIKDVVYLPYWQMYGELMLETVEGKLRVHDSKDIYLNTRQPRIKITRQSRPQAPRPYHARPDLAGEGGWIPLG